MKTTIKSLSALALALFVTLTFTQCQKDQEMQEMHNYTLGAGNEYGPGGVLAGQPAGVQFCECLTATYGPEELSDVEKEALLFMREEEKLARDVYEYLYETWSAPVFNNISRSESRHMEAMLCLIQRYGLEDPVGSDIRGEFRNQELAALYTSLIEKGKSSLVDALTAGATIEDVDINDLIQLSANEAVDNKDIQAAFAELNRGSRNHLRAFVRNLNQYAVEYKPQFISQQYFGEIIAGERETGGGLCAGLVDCPNAGSGNNGQCTGSGTGICNQDCTGPVGIQNGSGQGGGNGHGKGAKGGPN